eukprot:8275121-Pyramimonas_sp.AAC.1
MQEPTPDVLVYATARGAVGGMVPFAFWSSAGLFELVPFRRPSVCHELLRGSAPKGPRAPWTRSCERPPGQLLGTVTTASRCVCVCVSWAADTRSA